MQQAGEKDTVSQAQSEANLQTQATPEGWEHRPPCDWNAIDWKSANEFVRKLRQAIFRATREGDIKKVRTLQRIMLRSYENRVVSVRRVTQTNAGKHTPGVDKVVLKTPRARGKLVDLLGNYEPWKPLPARRVYIPKANGKQRPLGIPVIRDRALQAIVKNALEPFWEAQFEDSSYGFRPGRRQHDALMRIYLLGSAKSSRKWVLDADIKGCFDNIDHGKLMEVIGNFPARELVRQWLKAGYMEEEVFHETTSGTPQGGVISPLLANIALHGMEDALGIRFIQNATTGRTTYAKDSVALVRYADDFLVFCHTREEAEEAKQKLAAWFKERGLTFSEDKTRIVHLEEGFDFLGFNTRLYRARNKRRGFVLLMRPTRKAVKEHARKLKALFRKHAGHTADALCMAANQLVRGWVNYFRGGASSHAFRTLDNYLYQLQYCWVKRTHPKKPWKWRRKRYWGNIVVGRDANWTFKGRTSYMVRHAWTHIKRHVLVQRFACWDDPDLEEYWSDRKAKEAMNSLTGLQLKVAERQKWVCPKCRDWILNGEDWHEHHVLPRKDGGQRTVDNIELVHLFCHQATHGERQSKDS